MALTTLYLFTGRTTNGSGTGQAATFERPDTELNIWGTMGGGTITLESSPDGGTTWLSIPDENGDAFSATVAGIYPNLLVPYGDNIRATLSGATSPNIYVTIKAVYRGA